MYLTFLKLRIMPREARQKCFEIFSRSRKKQEPHCSLSTASWSPWIYLPGTNISPNPNKEYDKLHTDRTELANLGTSSTNGNYKTQVNVYLQRIRS